MLQLLGKQKVSQSCIAFRWTSVVKVTCASLCCKINNNWYSALSRYSPVRYKSYNRFLDHSKVPTLQEEDLQEQYARGSGPGGQATNKTSNAVILKHNPTGLVVKCHETRSLPQNRKIAREILLQSLDNLMNGNESLENQEARLAKRDSIKKKQKQRKLAEMKKAFKEREKL